MNACYQNSKGELLSFTESQVHRYLCKHKEDYLLNYVKYKNLVYFNVYYFTTNGIYLFLSPMPDPTEEELALCKRIATYDRDHQ